MGKSKETIVTINGKKVLVTVKAITDSATTTSATKVIMLDELNTWVQREVLVAR